MTYPDAAVSAAMTERFVALKLDHLAEPVRRLNVVWLPTLFVADRWGVVHYRSVNSLPPDDLLDVLDLGESHARLREAKYEIAARLLRNALSRRQHGPLTDELIYWYGIAHYFEAHHDHAGRDAIWWRLQEEYPDSIWTHRIP